MEKPSKFAWEFETLGDDALSEMLSEAQAFCRDMTERPGTPRWLSLVGTSGAGKTHLARKIVDYFKRNVDGMLNPKNKDNEAWRVHGGFISWRKLTDDLRSGEYGRFRDICEDWFVALDDIGAEHKTAFVTSKLDQLFDARQGKWTVITGNLSLAQIKDQMDARIASRMIRDGSVVVDVNVVDFNLRKRAA